MARTRFIAVLRARTAFIAAGVLLVLSALLVQTYAADDDPRPLRGVALIIGNATYENLPSLANPENDARAIEELLAGLGFETELSLDRDARRLARDLEYFVEDAEGADVAILYYAGHGIEAAGENFLVPVDADATALEAAGERLVPVSAIVARLRATVPVTIVMLDACRDNPFPAGATLRLAQNTEPAPVAAGGLSLGSGRGASALSTQTDKPSVGESLGIVIGFAAEPGRTALDGAPGENSPYASAILRHLGAMAGEDFGTVMRMVAEEVWLKTAGAQRPWVNESLRRLLYFGDAPPSPDGVEADILAERRQLLITISELPEFGRGRVKRIASQNGVPMDALFGLLNAMGAEAPDDPERLEEVLNSESVRIRDILGERNALASPDPEVARLSALADSAEREGLIESAKKLRARAKARDAEFQATIVDAAEEQVKRQRIASAEVFARSAQTYLLAFEHPKAAEDFAAAFDRVERWDDALAWRYKFSEFDALATHGDIVADIALLQQALDVGEAALRIADNFDDRERWAKTRNEIGHVLRKIGERETGTERLLAAVRAFEEAGRHFSRKNSPLAWAENQADLGRGLARVGERETGTDRLHEAIVAYHAALEVYPRAEAPKEWADVQIALGGTLGILGDRQLGPESFYKAIEAFEAALEELNPEDDPVLWWNANDGLGTAYAFIAERSSDIGLLEKAAQHMERTLESLSRERFPDPWANSAHNLGIIYRLLGQKTNNREFLVRSAETTGAALEIWTRDVSPMDWARAQSSLGVALLLMNGGQDGTDGYRAAIAAFNNALQEWTRDRVPLEWANATNSLALAYRILGVREQNLDMLYDAVGLFRSVLEVWTVDAVPLQWAKVQHNLGIALSTIAEVEGNLDLFGEAAAAHAAALEIRTPELTPLDWAISTSKLGILHAFIAYQHDDLEGMARGRTLIVDAIRQLRKMQNHEADSLENHLVSLDRAIEELAAKRDAENETATGD